MIIILYRKKFGKGFIDGELMVNGEHICDITETVANSLNTGSYKVRIDKCAVAGRQIIMLNDINDDMCSCCAATDCSLRKVNDKEVQLLSKAIDEGMENDRLASYAGYVHTETLNAKSCLHRTVCHRIVTGNGVNGLDDGRMIVGKRIAPGCVIRSKETFLKLYGRIEKSLIRGHEVVLEIV